ncbi:hypothetical protein FACS1894105_06950 [Clostridia bacterium]|nr:hypothetical protein FACS1894105_06950 [Clostridia bacterium]
MKITINPVKRETMECFDNNVIATLCEHWKRSVELYFLYCFCFVFDKSHLKNDMLFGAPPIYVGDRRFLSKRLKNIGLRLKAVEDKKKMLRIIKEQLELSLPVAVCIDSFWLPWNQEYLNNNATHFILVSGYDDISNSELTCVDGMLSPKELHIGAEHIISHCDYILLVEKLSEPKFSKSEMMEAIKDGFNEMDKTIMNEQLEMFSDYLASDESMHFANDEMIETSKLVFELSSLSWSRHNYADSLCFVDQITASSQFHDVIERLYNASRLWLQLKDKFIKYYYSGSITRFRNKLGDSIKTLHEKEREIIHNINQIIK